MAVEASTSEFDLLQKPVSCLFLRICVICFIFMSVKAAFSMLVGTALGWLVYLISRIRNRSNSA